MREQQQAITDSFNLNFAAGEIGDLVGNIIDVLDIIDMVNIIIDD